MRRFLIRDTIITDDSPCYLICEVGNNHQGSPAIARKLIDAAADAGAQAVKFQRRNNLTLYTQALLDQPYDNENSFGPTYGAHRAALELPLVEYPALIAHAHDRGMDAICTAFDEGAVDDIVAAGFDGLKLPSGAVTDLALIDHATRSGLPLIISTGGCLGTDIATAWEHAPMAAFLHCTASYPCDFAELNLSYITELRMQLDNIIGWSGHDSGIAMSVVAYTLGARIIERHVTLNRAQKGTDHAFSLEPAGLKKLCRDLARAHVALGDGVKRYYASERKPIAKMRRRQTPDGLKITGEMDA
jgi:N-acetylneuraminate synthase/sialic acid synthase